MVIILSYLLMSVIFSTTFLFIKIGLTAGWGPFFFSGVRFIGAGIIIILYFICTKKIRINSKDQLEQFILGLFMTGIPFAAIYWGEQFISSGMTALLVATSPIFIQLILVFRDKQVISKHQIIGIFSCMTGICLILLQAIYISIEWMSISAILLLLLAMFGFAYGNIKSKQFLSRKRVNPFLLNGFQMLYGGIFLLFVSFLSQEQWEVPTSIEGLGSLLFLCLLGSVLASSIFYWLIRMTNPFFPSTWTYISPIIAFLIGWYFIGETITVYEMIGTVLILGGIILSNMNLFRMLLTKN